MDSIRTRLALARDSDRGLTLIEVVVAMFIFAMVAVGIAYSMALTLTVTSDSRGRQTASNLASSAIDSIRAITNFSSVGPSTSTVTVDNRKYYVNVTTTLVGSTAGASSVCTSGSGALLYKSVNVDVTWDGMSKGAKAVQDDTAVAPSARINDPLKGVIVVSVRAASGAGNQGVTVSAVPATVNPNGAATITSTIANTDTQGCSVILQVTPGNYVVSISEPLAGNPAIDSNQSLTPKLPVPVAAGSSATAPFQFDQSSKFTPTYASNYVGTATLPTGMQSSFSNSYGIWAYSSAPYYLHPYTAGYTVLAGTLAASGSSAPSCKSVDPGQWTASTDGTLVGRSPSPVATVPGGATGVNVPMGVVQISSILSGGYLKAVAQTAGPAGSGDPGCDSPSTYTFSAPLVLGTNTIALPFGTWTFFTGTVLAQNSKVTTGITLMTPGSQWTNSGNTYVTLDPRGAP